VLGRKSSGGEIRLGVSQILGDGNDRIAVLRTENLTLRCEERGNIFRYSGGLDLWLGVSKCDLSGTPFVEVFLGNDSQIVHVQGQLGEGIRSSDLNDRVSGHEAAG